VVCTRGVSPRECQRALFQLAYPHGLRASEVSLLQRDDVHAKQGRIDIPRVKGSLAKTSPLQPEDLRQHHRCRRQPRLHLEGICEEEMEEGCRIGLTHRLPGYKADDEHDKRKNHETSSAPSRYAWSSACVS
jgi:integrase